MHDHSVDRGLRDAARLLQLGATPEEILGFIAHYDALHAEYGTTHAMPVAADCARLLDRYPGTDALHVIAPALDLCGESNRRLPLRTRSEAVRRGDGDALRRAVELENVELAEGIVRGFFAQDWPQEAIFDALYGVMADHFTDFGHPLIYTVKAQEFVSRLAPEVAADLLGALAVRVTWATREDTLPYLRGWFSRLAKVEDRLAGIQVRPEAEFDPIAFRNVVLEGRPGPSFDAVWGAIEAGVPAPTIARACVGAAAHRLLRFDLAVDRDPTVAETWLWATHRMTFAGAVRNAVERWDSPRALRLLVQTVAFTASGHKMDAPEQDRVDVTPAGAGDVAAVVAAIEARDAVTAVAETAAYLVAEQPIAPLAEALEDLSIADRFVRPITIAHAIKTTIAGREEYEAMAGHPDRDVPVLAAVRLLASPVVERRVQESVTRSVRWVVHGEMPRKLTQ
jgi:hypothetical protein